MPHGGRFGGRGGGRFGPGPFVRPGPWGPGPGGPWGPRPWGPFGWLWCCWIPPPPPPPGESVVVVVDSNGNPIQPTPVDQPAVATAASTNLPEANVIKPQQVPANQHRELRALEYREGDPAVRYYLTVPQDITYNIPINVDLGGRMFSVRIPEDILKGEKVVVVAPAPVNFGHA